MEIHRVKSLYELESRAAAWNKLAGRVPFRSWEWLSAWWEYYGVHDDQNRPRHPYVLCVEHQRQLVAVVPWYIEDLPWQGRVLKFLGSGPVCSEHLTIFCERDWETKVARAVADWLTAAAHEGPDGWDQIDLEGIDVTDLAMCRLAEQLSDREMLVHCRPGLPCWRVHLPSNWDDYLKMLSRSHRKELRSMQRRVWVRGRARLFTARTPEELTWAWNLLVDLHQRRRLSRGNPGCFAAPRFAGFHGEAVRRLLSAGWLQLNWLELDGRPVAAEYQLVEDGVIYAYQSGIEVDALAHMPGRLITMGVLREAIESGCRSYDLLRGNEPYKAHWRAQPHPTIDLCVLPNRGADRLRYGFWVAGDGMKGWLKNYLPSGGESLSPDAPWLEAWRDATSQSGITALLPDA